jgi:hypothetical protein
MQYFITYVLGHQSDSGKKAELGTIVHKVMEILSGLKKYKQDKPRVKYLKVVDDAVGTVRIDKDKLLTDDFVEFLIDLSFKSYAKNSKHKWRPADRKEMSTVTWLMLKHNSGQFDPRNRDIYETEPHFDIPIEEDWAKLEYETPDGKIIKGQLAIKGTIDLVTKISDDTIEVIDWKTGRRLNWATGEEKTFDKLMDDPQLLLYYYAISKLYPDFPHRIMSIFFCKDTEGEIDPKPFSLPFEKEDETRFLTMLKNRFEEIKQNQAPKLLSQNRTHWKCQRLCHFYKNNWPDTNQNMCIFIERHLQEHGLQDTINQCTRPGFDIGFYEAPG